MKTINIRLKTYSKVFCTVTYLTSSYSTLERACAHLILTNTTSEVFVAFFVTENWNVGYVKDSLISSPLKIIEKEKLVST